MEFKLDTGAEVTAISNEAYQTHFKKYHLQAPSKRLFGPAYTALKVIGQFLGNLSHGKKASKQTIYVVNGLKNKSSWSTCYYTFEFSCSAG